MKKFLISGIYMVFLLCMLASCGGGTEGGSVENGEEAEPPQEEAEAPKLLSQAELETLFQKVFDSEGDIQSQEDTQITAELSAVKEAADADTLPDDYETLYRSWREGQVTAWETEIEQLKEDYKKMLLADTDLTAAWDANKACYADYIDFDGNGISELLTVTRTWVTNSLDTVTVRVYGSQDGVVTELANLPFSLSKNWEGMTDYRDYCWIRVFKNGDDHQRYLGIYTEDTALTRNSGEYAYYTIKDGKWTLDGGFVSCNFDREGYVTGGVALYTTDDPEFFRDNFEWDKLSNQPIDSSGVGIDLSTMTGRYPDYFEILTTETPDAHVIEQYGILADIMGIKLTVNGEPVELGTQPFAEKGVFMAPVRPVLEAMGVAVYAMSKEAYADWRADDNFTRSIITGDPRPGPHQVVAATKKNMLVISRTWDDNAIANYGDYYLYCNDQMIEGYPPHMAGTQMVAPLTKMVECFGGSVVWSPDIRTLVVTCSIPETDRMSEAEIKSMVGFSLNDAAKVIEKQGYYKLEGFESYDDFGRSGSCWTFPVCPKGSEYQSEWLWDEIEGEKIVTNATWVTVYSDGTIVWGEAYEESLV